MELTKYVVGFMFREARQTASVGSRNGGTGYEVALISKLKPEWQKGKLNGIGGKVEKGEDEASAMVREFKEETGADTISSAWKKFATLYVPQARITFFSCLHGDMFNLRSVEAEPVAWYHVEDILAFRYPHLFNLTWLIPAALDPSDVHILANCN